MSFNFASRAVQAMMLDTVPEAEALSDELGRRMVENSAHAKWGCGLSEGLEREVRVFLDGLRMTVPLDTNEIRDFAVESVRSPLLPAAW